MGGMLPKVPPFATRMNMAETQYDCDKLLRLAKQGKLVLLVPVFVGGNVEDADFQNGSAFENIDDQTITLIVGDKRYVFASASLLGRS